jgi:hypothetical protein
MTDEEILKIYEEMKEAYGENLPHPEHEPIRFSYYLKIFKRYHKNETTNG